MSLKTIKELWNEHIKEFPDSRRALEFEEKVIDEIKKHIDFLLNTEPKVLDYKKRTEGYVEQEAIADWLKSFINLDNNDVFDEGNAP